MFTKILLPIVRILVETALPIAVEKYKEHKEREKSADDISRENTENQ